MYRRSSFRLFNLFRVPSLAYSGSEALPQSALELPLATSLVPSVGTGILTHTRATSAWMWRDSDGRMWRDYAAGRVLVACPAGELRFEGARRVRNLLLYSEGFSDALWIKVGVTLETVSIPLPSVVTSAATKLTVTTTTDFHYLYRSGSPPAAGLASIFVKKGNTRYMFISVGGATSYSALFDLDTVSVVRSYSLGAATLIAAGITNENDGWVRLWVSGLGSPAKSIGIMPTNNGSYATGIDLSTYLGSGEYVYISGAALYDITGLTNQSVPEYLSTNVLSYPYHGAGADGVAYYDTLLDGTPIPADEIAAVVEPQATNLLLNSAVLVTQSVTTAAQTYTLSFRGTGSVALSGTATGTLAGTGEHNRVQLTFTATAGTLTLTVTGSVTTAVLRAGAGAVAGTYIPTKTTTVTRNADVLTLTGYSIPDTAGTLYFEASATDWAQPSGQLFGDSTEYLLKPLTNSSGIQAFDGINTALGPTGTPTGMMKYAIRWDSVTGKMCLAANGQLGAEADYDGSWNLASQLLASDFAGTVRNLRIWEAAMSDARMMEITA